ncbi:MAG: LutC/YkgG family protein, partial [Terriglobia bacterium]
MSGSRAEILGKIRRALVKPRAAHHHGHSPVTSDLGKLFASVGSREGLVEKFQKEFELISGEFHFCESGTAALQRLTQIIQSSASKNVAISQHAICKGLAVAEGLEARLPDANFLSEDIESENSFDRTRLRNSMAQVHLSITGAEYLIAESGTIVTVAGAQASRQISLLPSIHLVLATPEQIFPNMAELFLEIQRTHGTKLPGSALTCITGPSRTADIEKVLIKGVHGP